MQLTQEMLDEWLEHPVTVLTRTSLARWHALQVEACKAAAWAGNPWPEAERLALRRAVVEWEDMFESNADDFRAMMER